MNKIDQIKKQELRQNKKNNIATFIEGTAFVVFLIIILLFVSIIL